jgi:nucleotide sugar dehydrogenase
MRQNILAEKDQRSVRVAVIGLGKIGLPLAVQYAQAGLTVIGCDINPDVVEIINQGGCHVHEEEGMETSVAELVQKGRLSATRHTAQAVGQASVVVVIVPVVVNERYEVDFTSIDAATRSIGDGLRADTLIIYETTLPAGTTEQRFRNILEERSGLQAGRDFSLAYSPERVSSGTIFRDLRTYPKIVGGIDERSTARAAEFYRQVLQAEVITMASPGEAEFVKLIETTYRDVNIALANEFARFADTHGFEVTAAIAAANTQPYSHIHQPGVGVGGHCIPVYPYFLLAGINEQDRRLATRELPPLTLPHYSRQINDTMAQYAVQRIEAVLGPLSGRAVLLLGVAYRGNVRETAFTSARLLRDALTEHGATVYVDDPLFTTEELAAAGYQPLRAEQSGEIVAILLQAGHREYQEMDFARFTNCRVVLDGRRALRRETIEGLGMHYMAIGDGHGPAKV